MRLDLQTDLKLRKDQKSSGDTLLFWKIAAVAAIIITLLLGLR